MKIFEVIEAKKRPADDWDDDEAPAQDADLDKVPHILMQMRKAIDTDGNIEFKFKDGSKAKLEMPDIVTFVKKYMSAKPLEKEEMQNRAIENLEGLMSVIRGSEKKEPEHKIKGSRYMSSFAGDYDDR